MNKLQFCSLPLAQALDCIWEASVKGFPLDQISAPEAPRPAMSPKYDSRMKTRGGYVYCSECDLSQLRYYLDRCSKVGDPKYSAKNEKDAKALGYFVAWREANPDAIWTGERYQQGQVRALAPSSRPKVTDWNDSGPAARSAEVSHDTAGDDVYGDSGDIPF
jgi:hypothetical protein